MGHSWESNGIWYVDQPSIWYFGGSENAVYPTNYGHWYYPEKRWSLIKLWVHYLIGQTEPLFNLIHTESASFSFWHTSMIDPHSLRKQNPLAISQQPQLSPSLRVAFQRSSSGPVWQPCPPCWWTCIPIYLWFSCFKSPSNHPKSLDYPNELVEQLGKRRCEISILVLGRTSVTRKHHCFLAGKCKS